MSPMQGRTESGPTTDRQDRHDYWGVVLDAEDAHEMMVHLDFEVTDLEAAVASAIASGAEIAAYQPQEDVRVMLDPDGHPFCLYRGQ
jgi:hypothetical protein